MKINVGFLFYIALIVCNAHAADLVTKVLQSSRGMELDHDTADDNLLGVYQVMSNVLLQVGELKGTINQISHTVSKLSQTVDQLNSGGDVLEQVGELNEKVDQMSQTIDQLSSGGDVLEQVGELKETVNKMSQTVSQLSQKIDQPSQGDDQQNRSKTAVLRQFVKYFMLIHA